MNFTSVSVIIIAIIGINLLNYAQSNISKLKKSVENVPQAEDTLIFAQIIFRHGQRARSKSGTYPTDPHKYSSYFPYNNGDITKAGMLETYKLGLELGQRYGKFLGKTYNSHVVGALSSPQERCQNSLQCVLTAMFPPSEEERFLDDLPWRPISYDILPKDKDDMFAVFDCDNYFNLTSSITNKTILDLCAYMETHTGLPMKNTSALFNVCDAIITQVSVGMEQPDWVHKVFPEPLESAAYQLYYDIIDQRLEYGAAGLYKRITKFMLDKLNGTLSPPRRKIMLYAGHEQNFIFALGGIKAYRGQVPKYALYLSYELHHINHTYGIKVYLQNYDKVAPVPINILGYGEFCPLDRFINGVRWLLDSRKKYCEF